MTEKQFKIHKFTSYNSYKVHSGDWFQVYEKTILNKNDGIEETIVYGEFGNEREAKQLCDLLNMLHEENRELRKMNVELKKQIIDLRIENEQLKQQLADVDRLIDSLCNRVDGINRSNEFK